MSNRPELDVAHVRAHFPSLVGGAAHFDGPGGSQTPREVAAAMAATLTAPLANRGSVTQAERNAEKVVTNARRAMADLLHVEAGGIVFGRSMTALTFDFARTLAKTWSAGEEIVVSRLDHDANIRPWVIAAARAGVTVRWVEFDPTTGELDVGAVEQRISSRTRLVALTGASNLIGTMPDLPAVAEVVHEAGGVFFVDGVHLSAHRAVDVPASGADVYACSPYKFLGPHCGVLCARPELLERLDPDRLAPSSDRVPERFELGTLPYELLAGTTAAVELLADLVPSEGTRRQRLVASMRAVEEHEDALRRRVEAGLTRLPGVRVHSRAVNRTPTLLVTFDGHDSAGIYRFLAERGVNAPAGSFYALEASRHLGLGDTGGLRIGLAPYTDEADVDRLLEGLDAYFDQTAGTQPR